MADIKLPGVDLYPFGFSIYVSETTGDLTKVAEDLTSKAAARRFWQLTNNVSAVSGKVRYVVIVNHNGQNALAWQFGRGYTYDGEEYMDRPVFHAARRDYGKETKR